MSEDRCKDLEKRIEQLEEQVDKMQSILSNIEKDIYDEDFDFEIVCPYCNNDFVVDFDENMTEVICPECNNKIELDWSGDPDEEDGCSGHCHGCSGCGDSDVDEDDM